MVDNEDVRRIALSFPSAVEEGTGFGVKGKGFAWYYMQKIAGQRGRVSRFDVLAVRVAHLEEKDALIAAEPEKFFTDDHYCGYPAVLVHLSAIDADELAELMADAWRTRAPKTLLKAFDAHGVTA